MERRHRGSQPVNDDIGIRELIVGHREVLKHAAAFNCICCRQDKASGDAEGVHVYKTDDPVLQRAMQTPGGPRVGTYVICSPCVDSLPDEVIHEKVTATFAKAGLFGRIRAVRSNTEGIRKPEVPEIGRPEERERDRWELKRQRAERVTTALIAALVRLQQENERLREEIYRRDTRRLNMAQSHHRKPGNRKNPKVSIRVTYEAVGHDKAAYERLLEYLRELARSKESSQIEQKSKS